MPYYSQSYYLSNFNSSLTPEEQIQFLAWAKEESQKKGRNVLYDLNNYDLQGAYKELSSGKMKEDERGHLGDKYKKPNHPTFSNESIYHGYKDPKTGEIFQGGRWGENGSTFTPSSYMLNNQPKGFLQNYLQQYEPGTKLLLAK